MLFIIWTLKELQSFCWWKVLAHCWWLSSDQGGGCWRLGRCWRFLQIRQLWSLLYWWTLPFTWTLTGCCRVINWLNFNIFVSQGIGRPEQRERQNGLSWSSQNTSIHQKCSLPYMRWFVALWNNYYGKVKDDWSQMTIINTVIMKKFEILWEWLKCDPETWRD